MSATITVRRDDDSKGYQAVQLDALLGGEIPAAVESVRSSRMH
ncbi:MAG: hypothetical protein ACLR1V_14560 [Coprococcus sp.]